MPPTSVWLNTFPRNQNPPQHQPKPIIIHHTVPPAPPAPIQKPWKTLQPFSVLAGPIYAPLVALAVLCVIVAGAAMTSTQSRTPLLQDPAPPPSNGWSATSSPLASSPANPRESSIPYVDPPKWKKPTPESAAAISPGLPMYHYVLPAVPLPRYAADWNPSGTTGSLTVTRNPEAPAPQTETDVVGARELQEKMKAFGIFNGTISGQLDKPTHKAMQTLAALMGDGTPTTEQDIGDSRLAIDTLQGHADEMLYAVDHFPFAGKAPTWLLSLLEDSDVASIAEQVESALNNEVTQAITIDAGRGNVRIIAITRTDPVQGSLLHCRAYHLTFAKGPMHFAVTARACRNPTGTDWRIAHN